MTLTNWPPIIAPAGATLTIGALAGSVALYAAVSWEDQRAAAETDEAIKRDKDREFETWKIRAGYYDKIAVSAVKQFVTTVDLVSMAEDRGRVVMWGSAEVVKALEEWDVAAKAVVDSQVERAKEDQPFSDLQKMHLWSAFSKLIQTMRSELPDEAKPTLTDSQILRAVFADYRDLDDKGLLPGVSKVAVGGASDER